MPKKPRLRAGRSFLDSIGDTAPLTDLSALTETSCALHLRKRAPLMSLMQPLTLASASTIRIQEVSFQPSPYVSRAVKLSDRNTGHKPYCVEMHMCVGYIRAAVSIRGTVRF